VPHEAFGAPFSRAIPLRCSPVFAELRSCLGRRVEKKGLGVVQGGSFM